MYSSDDEEVIKRREEARLTAELTNQMSGDSDSESERRRKRKKKRSKKSSRHSKKWVLALLNSLCIANADTGKVCLVVCLQA